MRYLHEITLLFFYLMLLSFQTNVLANNELTTISQVNEIDLALSLTVDQQQYEAYEEIDYTLTITNSGSDNATGVIVSIPVPEDMAFTSNNPSTGTYFNWTGEWSIEKIGPGESEIIELTFFTKREDNPITCFAQVIAADQTDADSTPDNNSGDNPNEDDEAAVTIYTGDEIPCTISAAQFTVDCDDNGTADEDDDIFTFTLDVDGANGSDRYNLSGDVTSEGISYGFSSAIDGSFLISEGALTLTITDELNENCKLEDVVINPPEPCSTDPTSDGVDLELSLTVGQSTYTQYENVEYVLTIKNNGTEDATNVTVGFPKPADMAHTDDDPSVGEYSAWSGIWKVGDLASQATEVLNVIFYTKEEGNDITILAQVLSMDQDDVDSTPGNNNGEVPTEDDEAAVTIVTEGDVVPEGCSITSAGVTVSCDDNDTESPEDDIFRISLDPDGIDLGSTYSVSGDITASNLPYGEDAQIGEIYSINGEGVSITIIDDEDPTCQLSISIDRPSPCSFVTPPINIVDYTANDSITPYTGYFRPGVNPGYNPPWKDEQLAELAAGNEALGIKGVGVKSTRPALFGSFVEVFGYDHEVEAYDYFESLGLKENTCIVGFPPEWQRDHTSYCEFGIESELYANLYDDIWDDGENGTPVNDNNYYALYLYKLVTLYKDHIRFWEIWNEPGFDFTFATAWQPAGNPGNWWDNNPDPCDYKLRAPIFHYVRTLRISWEVIKALDPDAYVTVAGVGQPSFLDAILRNTDNPNDGSATSSYPLKGGAYFDCMGFHSYPHFDGSMRDWDNDLGDFVYERHSDIGVDGILDKRGRYEDVLYSYGYDGETYPKKENIITEINLPRQEFENWIGSQEAQTNFLIKAMVTCMQNDIHQMHVFNLADKTNEQVADDPFEIMGLYRQLRGGDAEGYDYKINPEGIVYKTASDILFKRRHDEERTAELNLPDGVRGGAFKNEDDEYVYVLWAATSEDMSEDAYASYEFPSSLGLDQLIRRKWDYSETGSESMVDADDVNLNATPIFLMEPTVEMELRTIPIAVEGEALVINKIYPNPPVNEVTISIHSVEEEVTVELVNVNGQVITQLEVATSLGHNKINLDLSKIETGVYFARVSDSKTNQQIRFVKQKK